LTAPQRFCKTAFAHSAHGFLGPPIRQIELLRCIAAQRLRENSDAARAGHDLLKVNKEDL
jgi:hypothetical protein